MDGESGSQTESFEFHLKEYETVRQDFLWNFNAAYNALFYSLIANSFVIAWISSELSKPQKLEGVFTIAACLPILLSITSWLLYLSRRRSIGIISQYCLKLEEKFAFQNLGMSNFYTHERSKDPRIFKTRFIFQFMFVLQFILAVYFAYYVITNS